MAKNQAPQTDEVDQLLALNKTAGASSGPSKSGGAVDAFVRDVRPLAEAVGKELGVDPAVLAGQWGLETGWGKSVIPGTNNYGNIKEFRGGGVSAKDNMNGSVDKYRAYGSPEEFAKDYAQLIRGRRYSAAMGSKDAQSFFSALKAGGYAEDPNYVRSGVRAAEMARNAMGGSSPSASLYPSRGEYIGNTEKVLRDSERQAISDESPLSTSLDRGWEGLKHNAGLFLDNLADDSEGAAERIRAKREWDEANPAPSSSTKFLKQWQNLAEDDYMGMLGSVLSNPGGMVNQLVEQAPNSLPGLALQVPVALATTGLIASGWGAPIAIGLQGLASFVGNVLPEGGSVIEERLAKAGVDPNNTQAVARWISESRGANLEAGVKKAGVISAVDGATGYLVGKLIAGPSARFAQAEAKVFADAGVDVSNKAARDAARATPAYKAAMAEPAKELLAATTTAQKVARHAGGFAAETVGEGVGEYGGSYAANGEASVKDAVLESLMGAGTSAAMTGAGSVMSAMKAPEMARADLEALAATPVQPTIEANSPLSNMASIGQAEAANAAQAAGAPQVDATVQAGESGASSDPIATRLAAMQSFVEDKAFIQALRGTQGYGPESVTEMLSAFAKARNPNIDPMVRERALSDLEGFIQGFNNRPNFVFGENTQERTQPPGQQVVPVSQNGRAVSRPIRRDDGRTLDGEIITRPDTMASANPNQLSAPPVLGLPTEEALAAKRQADADYDQAFQDLLKAEQLGATEAELAEYQRTLMEAERLRNELAAQLSDTDARVSDAQRREAEARRREILTRVIEEGISGVNPVADVSNRFAAELRRQGYRNADPTEAETQSILRAVDVANAREDGPLPSLPNEADFYEPPKPPRAAAPKAEPKPKQQPALKLTPLEIRKYIAAGAVLSGDALTLPDGTTIKLKGPQVAAAREAIRKAGPAQVETAPVEASGSVMSEQGAEPQEVETADAASESEPSRSADEPVAEDLAGEKIDSEWTAFAPETGTLGIPRDQMPQIKAEHRGAMTNFMNARGVDHRSEEVPAEILRPTQAEFSPEKVKKAMEFDGGDRSILVSSDGYVLDGHHQWLAKRETGDPIKVIRLDAPIAQLVPLALEFPSSTTAGDEKADATSAAQEDPREAFADAKEQAYIAKRGGKAPPKAVEMVRVGAYREYDRQNGTHQDPGQPAEAVTPAVVAESVQKSARNTDMNIKEAKAYLLSEIDRAIAEVPAENSELAQELERERSKSFDERAAKKSAMSGKAIDAARNAFDALRDSNIAKTAAQIGFVTFDVPGDGKFKVMNTAEGLAEFRKKVAASAGFKEPPSSPPLPQRETDVGSYTPRDAIADGEYLNAYELARLQGKPLRFGVAKDKPNAFTDASEVEGLIPGFKTFVGRLAENKGAPWLVIEESSGLSVGKDTAGSSSKAAAIADAKARLKGNEQFIADKLTKGVTGAKDQAALEAEWLKWVEQKEGRTLNDDADQNPIKSEAPASTEESAEAAAPDQESIKNPEPDPLDFTPKQYHEARMAWVAQEYDLSPAEVHQDYDTEAARADDDRAWVDAVRQAFKDGKELTRATLDKLEEVRPGAFLSFLHDHPDAKVPESYQTPAGRQVEKDAAEAKREDRAKAAASLDTEAIFTGLASRGLAKTRAKQAAASHPQAEQIAYVQENFHDILIQLMDAGKLEVNGSKTVTEDNKTCL